MKDIRIEYCTAWGYLDRAVALTANLLNEHKNNIKSIVIVPSSGGVFEISVGDQLVFSKKKLARFPDNEEAENLIRKVFN